MFSDFHFNYLEEGTNSIISKFTDDAKIFRVTATPAQILDLQDDINKLQQWADHTATKLIPNIKNLAYEDRIKHCNKDAARQEA